MNLNVNKMRRKIVEEQDTEIVERKGLGHPDFMTDSIMEEFSVNLCKEYMKRFGKVLHHNVDKGDVVGGKTKPSFGGGEIEEPILMFFSGRATSKVEGEEIPIKEIAMESAKEWISKNFRFLNPEGDVRYEVETKGGAGNLKEVFEGRTPRSNDTSIGQSYAPLTDTEMLVYQIEEYLNSRELKNKHPFVGEDVKVMGVRKKDVTHVTVACAFIDNFVTDIEEYFELKEELTREIENYADGLVDEEVVIYLNVLDEKDEGIDGVYLTVTGTSAEMGDDGQVGRGNRVTGVCPYNRPISLEATAGKNPVSHVGKIYNVLSRKMSKRIYEEINAVKEVYVRLVSQIGKPIDNPLIASVNYVGGDFKEGRVEEIINSEFEKTEKYTKDIINKKIGLF